MWKLGRSNGRCVEGSSESEKQEDMGGSNDKRGLMEILRTGVLSIYCGSGSALLEVYMHYLTFILTLLPPPPPPANSRLDQACLELAANVLPVS